MPGYDTDTHAHNKHPVEEDKTNYEYLDEQNATCIVAKSDFNAIEREWQDGKSWKYGIEKINKGQRLVDFCNQHSLIEGNI